MTERRGPIFINNLPIQYCFLLCCHLLNYLNQYNTHSPSYICSPPLFPTLCPINPPSLSSSNFLLKTSYSSHHSILHPLLVSPPPSSSVDILPSLPISYQTTFISSLPSTSFPHPRFLCTATPATVLLSQSPTHLRLCRLQLPVRTTSF